MPAKVWGFILATFYITQAYCGFKSTKYLHQINKVESNMTKQITDNFTAKEGYKPYTYLVGWSSLNKYYYGVKYGRKADPNTFWVDYFTSSSYVQEYRELYGEPDIIQIRREFDDPSEAVQWENRVLQKILSSSNPNRGKWLNVSKGYQSFSITDECIEKLRDARNHYIATRSDEQKARDYKSRMRAARSDESRRKISEKAKQRFEDPNYREKMSEATWHNDTVNEEARQRTTALHQDPDYKAKRKAGMSTDEYREGQRRDSKARCQDPEYNKHVKAKIREAIDNDPDYYKKKSERAQNAVGNVLASKILKKMSDTQVLNMFDDDYAKFIRSQVNMRYDIDMEKALIKFNERKKSINT